MLDGPTWTSSCLTLGVKNTSIYANFCVAKFTDLVQISFLLIKKDFVYNYVINQCGIIIL